VNVIRLAGLRDEPLSVDEVMRAVTDPSAGGITVFTGVVRDHDRGRPVQRLTYSAHPSAVAELHRVAGKIAADYDLRAVAVLHRLGALGVGEIAIIVAVSSPHRGDAFDACRALVDEVKSAVPIWKHQEFGNGESEWVNCA
jgi:molybdopterin synthase catalytic subunit